MPVSKLCKTCIRVDPTDDDFGAVLNCAVRYAVGRRTYMPHIVIAYIVPLLHSLTDKTLWCFDQDLSSTTNFGDSQVDEPHWREFHQLVKDEIERRKNENR